MGSGSSRLGSSHSRPRDNCGERRRLSSFICGGFSSAASAEIGDYPAELLTNSQGGHGPVSSSELQCSRMKFSSIIHAVTECSSSKTEDGTSGMSSESSNGPSKDFCMEHASRSIGASNNVKNFTKSKESVPCQVKADSNPIDVASTSFKGQQSVDLVSVNVGNSLDAIVEVDDSKDEIESCICTERTCSSSTAHQEFGDSSADVTPSVGNSTGEVLGVHDSDADSVHVVSDSPVALQSLGDDSPHEAALLGLGFPLPDRHQQRTGSVLHVDMVSISSNFLSSSSGDINNRDARRNNRRLFWDAFSRQSSRRHIDSPTIVFSTEDADDLGSPNRWLLDFSGDLFEDGFGGDLGYLGRSHGIYQHRWNSGPEIWERHRGDLDESGRRTTFCASGLHPDGTCSCGSFLVTEESGTRASISRIVMLAEALFEVLHLSG
ncbi:PREDICTED: uncharacterized protein LOC104588570 isoform X2 [Nelumbo nucifera]|uniref:Uncharacterized protein LOC104588570 isoform X2 n=1 Tax=Nelumbo nucifera TaxID=4432 RepID=A0A1U7ZAS2_NELNU|nr:PREDICTED: uncharacterized protein LOC104588570 isoform X2 [Nelumbo nucifera]